MKVLMLSIIDNDEKIIAVGIDRLALEHKAKDDAAQYGLPEPVFEEVDESGFSSTPTYHRSCNYFYMISPVLWCGPDSMVLTFR